MPADLASLLHTYLDAKLALTDANNAAGEPDRKLGVIHKGTMYLVQMNKDGIAGMAVGPLSDGAVPVGTEPQAEAPKKRGRPAKTTEAPIPGPGSTGGATPENTVDANAPDVTSTPPAEPPMSKDKFRAAARDIAARIGIEPTKAIIGCPIDELPADQYADRLAKLEAANKEVL